MYVGQRSVKDPSPNPSASQTIPSPPHIPPSKLELGDPGIISTRYITPQLYAIVSRRQHTRLWYTTRRLD
ncbi:hypothetical protein K491DRAFT_690861 [Lophiostoma macrostomum CBS 122681]|uniref:Uncharacterized protein n=1 Tax=Lophiostoma macrostomum CBS 122681 TaxID=1314788 RepID=A0A6A6TE77_9PLEO|nr:hypothetical protein K491DRAFT_690861 [Lophiostoma macrostomum CBS 122681]